MQIEKTEQEQILELARVCTRPGSWVLQDYNESSQQHTTLEKALASQRPFVVVAPEHLMVIDADANYFEPESKLEQIKYIQNSLFARGYKFVIVKSGTGFHIWINLWTVESLQDKENVFNRLTHSSLKTLELLKEIGFSKLAQGEAIRKNRGTRLPLTPHKRGYPVSLIYPQTIEEAIKNLSFGGVLGRRIKPLRETALKVISGTYFNQLENRSVAHQALADSLFNSGYTFEDFEWVILQSKTTVSKLSSQRQSQRGLSDRQIKNDLRRNWEKAFKLCTSSPPESVARIEVENWLNWAIGEICQTVANTRQKSGLLAFVIQIAAQAYKGNTTEPIVARSLLVAESQLSDSSIPRYNQLVTRLRLLTISQESALRSQGLASTRYKLQIPNQINKISLINPKNALKPNYPINGDVSAFIQDDSEECNSYCHVDLGVLSGIWGPHDCWFATSITGGISGKIVWHLAQSLMQGNLENLLQILDGNSKYFSGLVKKRLMQSVLLEERDDRLHFCGNGTNLDSLADVGQTVGRQRKRITNIEYRREQRAINRAKWGVALGLLEQKDSKGAIETYKASFRLDNPLSEKRDVQKFEERERG